MTDVYNGETRKLEGHVEIDKSQESTVDNKDSAR
jgi:hypothetical protein